MACTSHRILLASIIVAEKYLCDIPLKNITWAYHTKGYFGIAEINLMEQQFLGYLVLSLIGLQDSY